jgi:hypothetical protein
MLLAKSAIFIELKLVRRCALVFGRRIISLFALGAGQRNDDSHRLTPCFTR